MAAANYLYSRQVFIIWDAWMSRAAAGLPAAGIPSSMAHFELINHTADLGLLVWGESIEDLFTCAAGALGELVVEQGEVRGLEERRLCGVTGADWEELFVNFLREVLFLINGEQFIPAECRIESIVPYTLTAVLQGEPFDPQRHHWTREIKAVTYHGAEVVLTSSGWRGKVIFDV